MNSGQNKKLPKKEKREVILQASWKLIHQYGYQKTTIEDIAKEAGIAKGTIYLYFKSKSEIMLTLVDVTNLRIADEQDRIAAKDSPPIEKLRACLKHRIMTLFDIINRYPHGEEMVSSLLPDIVHRLDWYVTRNGELLGKIIEEGCAERVFDVAIQGRTVLEDFDIAREAGGPLREVAREFTGISAAGTLSVTFTPTRGDPLACGIELIAEGAADR